jgi:hypothetical protein
MQVIVPSLQIFGLTVAKFIPIHNLGSFVNHFYTTE